MGCRQLRLVSFLPNTRRDSGSCRFCVPRRASIFAFCHLTIVTIRSSLRSSSHCELPTRGRFQAAISSLGASVQFIFGVKLGRLVETGPSPMGLPRVRGIHSESLLADLMSGSRLFLAEPRCYRFCVVIGHSHLAGSFLSPRHFYCSTLATRLFLGLGRRYVQF